MLLAMWMAILSWFSPWFWRAETSWEIMGANITSWSPQAQDYICDGPHGKQIIMIQEHRQKGPQVEAMAKRLRRSNWTGAITPAVEGLGGGSSAGTAILWRSHLQAKRVCMGTDAEREGRVTFTNLRLKGMDVLLASLYCWVGLGTGSANADLLAEVGETLHQQTAPWLIAADWNFEAEELRDTGWLTTYQGMVVEQPDVKVTCRSGGEGSLIDYFVASKKMVHLIEARGLDSGSPWSPHAGILVGMTARPLAARMCRRPTPRELPTELGQDGLSWQEALDKAAKHLETDDLFPDPVLKQHVATHPWREGVVLAELSQRAWNLASEFWTLSRSAVEESEWYLYLGRGKVQPCKWMPVVEAEDKQLEPTMEACIFWGALAQRLQDWRIARRNVEVRWFEEQSNRITKQEHLTEDQPSYDIQSWVILLATIDRHSDNTIFGLHLAAKQLKCRFQAKCKQVQR